MLDIEIDERNAARDERVLTAARAIVTSDGLSALTRETIAQEAGVSPASVSNFGRSRISNGDHSREGYRTRIMDALMVQALDEQNDRLIAIGVADGFLTVDTHTGRVTRRR
jgi:AcrR family transcriptional regulator